MSSRDIGEADKRAPRDYSFGDFTLEVDGGFLRKGADEVALRPKTFSVLTYLVERHGRLVTKTELIDAIWGDVAVTENSLAQCLLEIRRALADDSQRMIRTVPRRGYIFVAPVSARTLSFPRFPERVAAAEEPRPRALPEPPFLRRSGVYWAVALALLISVSAVAWTQRERAPRPVRDTQLTDFADSATSPAISPDGRMLAFLRGSKTFLDTGQLYVMRLPDGEPVALTRDDHSEDGPGVLSRRFARRVHRGAFGQMGDMERPSPWRRATDDAGKRGGADVGRRRPILVLRDQTRCADGRCDRDRTAVGGKGCVRATGNGTPILDVA